MEDEKHELWSVWKIVAWTFIAHDAREFSLTLVHDWTNINVFSSSPSLQAVYLGIQPVSDNSVAPCLCFPFSILLRKYFILSLSTHAHTLRTKKLLRWVEKKELQDYLRKETGKTEVLIHGLAYEYKGTSRLEFRKSFSVPYALLFKNVYFDYDIGLDIEAWLEH